MINFFFYFIVGKIDLKYYKIWKQKSKSMGRYSNYKEIIFWLKIWFSEKAVLERTTFF